MKIEENDFHSIFKYISDSKEKNMIHCLTNPISMNDMANVLLSLNMSPFMADNPKEVSEITRNSKAVLYNLGNIQDYRIESFMISSSVAKKNSIATVIDLVGAGASNLRMETAINIIKNSNISLIKGNYSEIQALFEKSLTNHSVDSKLLEKRKVVKYIKAIYEEYNTMVLATGEEDLIYDGEHMICLQNGNQMLSKVTGTGCIVGAISAAFLSIKKDIKSVILAVSFMNIAAELVKAKGCASFRCALLDEISLMSAQKIMEKIKWKEIE